MLLKYVMSSLPVYLLSFFKAPTFPIETLFRCFFGGGCEIFRKILWISYDTTCSDKENGWLGRLGFGNLIWHCWKNGLEDEDMFWFKVLVARYMLEIGTLHDGGRLAQLGRSNY